MYRTLILLLPFASLGLTACDKDKDTDEPLPDVTRKIALSRFTSCDVMRDYVAEVWTEYLVQSVYGWGWGIAEDDAEAGGDGDGGADAPTDWSETNVQEAGVDEPDMVKSDGDYLYIVQNAELSIVDAWPADETHLVSTLALEGYPFASFLSGDRLAVLSTWYEGGDGVPEGRMAADFRYGTAARLSVIDVSDRAAPVEVRQIDLDGWYTAARMIDADIYWVAQTWAQMPEGVWSLAWDGTIELPTVDADATAEERAAVMDEARALLEPEVQAIVNDLPIEDLLPRYRDQVPGEDADLSALGDCTDIYRTGNLSLPATLVLSHLNLDEGEAGSDLSATSVMADGWTVYASTDELYVAQTSWGWYWDDADTELSTQIHKFSLAGADSSYEASGEVTGWLLSSYSMGAADGDLRVATTDVVSWWGGAAETDGAGTDTGVATTGRVADEEVQANNVFVLRQAGGELETIGALTGLAPGEQIYAARFLGDTGYLVTFEQVDPLFTIDLSDPTNPTLVGELEVQGYSSYLHPTEDGAHLLAVGMEGTPEGSITGFAISLFDVSDLASPALDDRLSVTSDDWSWSESLWDPHAFTYYNGILSVPLYTYDYDSASGDWAEFSGLWVVAVDEAAGTLTELGRVDHADLVAASECLYGDWEGCASYYWYAWMRRSVVVEDALYSISDYGVKVNDQAVPETELATVIFHPKE